MSIERVDDADDARIAAYRDVRDGHLMRTRGLFVAEGRLILRRVVEDNRYRVQSVLVNDAALRDLASTFATIEPHVPIFACKTDDLTGLAGYHVHRGCLALVERPPATPMDEVLASAETIVVLESVSNADNIGGVFRNAAALGAGGVVLSPTCCDPLYRKAIRTSMGAVLCVPFACAGAGEWPGALTRIRAAGFALVALTPREPSATIDAFAARAQPPRIALLVGAEGAGLSPAVENAADDRVRIPISDRVDSLNLATAVGIALHALRARRTA
jgi:tRNA G18 (ribose-2'-O)-methylase SpoU